MRVIMVGNIAHVIVHVNVAELASCYLAEALVHVTQMLGRRLRAVKTPYHHRHVAHITLGNPANIVLVVPGRDAGRSTEITPVHLDEGMLWSCHGAVENRPGAGGASTRPPCLEGPARRPTADTLLSSRVRAGIAGR
jgi:hypothetical protein